MTEALEPAAERRAAAAVLEVLLAAGCREIRLPQWLDYDLAREDLGRSGVNACKFVAPDGRVMMLLPDPTLGVLQVLPAAGRPARVCYWADAFRVIDGEWVRRPQVGAELLGYPSRRADPEVLLLALDAVAAAGCRRVRLVLNDAGLTEGLCSLLPSAAAGRARLALAAGDFVELE
ncbi:MAG TPA: ATP phosphoribosyltransferase regulatory subunit, partial [Bacillota bacterium]